MGGSPENQREGTGANWVLNSTFPSDSNFFSSYSVLSPYNSPSERNRERSVDGEGQRHHTTGPWTELGCMFQTTLLDSDHKYHTGPSFQHLSWNSICQELTDVTASGKDKLSASNSLHTVWADALLGADVFGQCQSDLAKWAPPTAFGLLWLVIPIQDGVCSSLMNVVMESLCMSSHSRAQISISVIFYRFARSYFQASPMLGIFQLDNKMSMAHICRASTRFFVNKSHLEVRPDRLTSHFCFKKKIIFYTKDPVIWERKN